MPKLAAPNNVSPYGDDPADFGCNCGKVNGAEWYALEAAEPGRPFVEVWRGKPREVTAIGVVKFPGIKGLKPNTLYTFRARAGRGTGRAAELSDPSPTKQKRTKPMPLKPVIVAKPAGTTPPPVPDPGPGDPPPPPATPDLIGMAPYAVHLDAVDAGLTPETLRDKLPAWHFGDAARFNAYQGATAGNVFDAPGDRTVTRTIAGVVRTWLVRVTADARRRVHLSAAGNDANDGATEATAVATWARACQLVGNGTRTKLAIRRGDVFPVAQTLKITGSDAWVTTYGAGTSPRLVVDWAVSKSLTVIQADGARVVVEGLTFGTINTPGLEQTAMPVAVGVGGTAVTVRDCVFQDVGYAVNANAAPVGLLVMGCTAPTVTSIRGYLVFGTGENLVVLGCWAPNSTREHIVRLAGFERATVSYNRFANRGGTDATDIQKGTLTVQRGSMFVAIGNVLEDGDLGVGPLGSDYERRALGLDGVYLADNRVTRAGVKVYHGTRHVTIRNNLVAGDGGRAILIQGWNLLYGRGVDDVLVHGNTFANGGTGGEMIYIDAGATRVQLVANLDASPNRSAIGGPCFVNVADVGSLTRCEGNRIATPAKSGKNGAGLWILGGGYESLAAMLARAPLDKVMTVPAGTLALEGAGVDVSKLPALTA